MSFKNTCKSSLKQFFLQLAKIYDKMCSQLFRIANKQGKKLYPISGILQKSTIKNSIDRKIVIQNQLQLFREALNTTQAFIYKKNTKKSEVAMKFIYATQVLINRIKSQVLIGKQEKANILLLIQENKQQIQKVWQNKSNKSTLQKQTDSTKVTNVLKFAYTETTRPTTAALSRIQSAIQTPEQRGTLRTQTHKNTIQENLDLGYKKNQRQATDTSLVSNKKSKKYKYNKTFCNTEEPSKKVNNLTVTQSQSQYSIILQKNQPNKPVSPIINDEQEQIKCQDRMSNSKKTNNFCRSKNIIQFQQNQKIQSSQDLNKNVEQQKKSLYYTSQNYLKSNKKIEVLNHKKKHKVSACVQNNEQIFENTDQMSINYKEPLIYQKYRKFVTRKDITDQLKYENLIKSQKSIPRCSAAAINQVYKKKKIINEISKISKMHKIKNSQILANSLSSYKKITPDLNLSHYRNKLYEGDLGVQAQNEWNQAKYNPQSKTIKQIYSELITVRKDFIEKSDPNFTTFSSFFNQQILLQQESRRIQKLVNQSKNYRYLQEFQMMKNVTKLQRQSNIYRQQVFLAGIRGNLIDCNPLGQIGPQNNEI